MILNLGHFCKRQVIFKKCIVSVYRPNLLSRNDYFLHTNVAFDLKICPDLQLLGKFNVTVRKWVHLIFSSRDIFELICFLGIICKLAHTASFYFSKSIVSKVNHLTTSMRAKSKYEIFNLNCTRKCMIIRFSFLSIHMLIEHVQQKVNAILVKIGLFLKIEVYFVICIQT